MVTWPSPLQSPVQVDTGVSGGTVGVGVKTGDAVTVAVFSTVAVGLASGVRGWVAVGTVVAVAVHVGVDWAWP